MTLSSIIAFERSLFSDRRLILLLLPDIDILNTNKREMKAIYVNTPNVRREFWIRPRCYVRKAAAAVHSCSVCQLGQV